MVDALLRKLRKIGQEKYMEHGVFFQTYFINLNNAAKELQNFYKNNRSKKRQNKIFEFGPFLIKENLKIRLIEY